MTELNEEMIQKALQSGMFSSRDEIATHLHELSMLRKNSLVEAVARGDIDKVCDLVIPTLFRLRRMAGNHSPLDLSFFQRSN